MWSSLRIQTPRTGTGVVSAMMGTTDPGSAWWRALFFRNSNHKMARNDFAVPNKPRAPDA